MKFKFIVYLIFIFFISEKSFSQPHKGEGKNINITEEIVAITISSAPVYEWFEIIEQQDIILSYNPQLINLNKICKIDIKQLNVENLLKILLKGYSYELIPADGRKIIIKINREKKVNIRGTVKESRSLEKLYGAIVSLRKIDDNQKWHLFADENGVFTSIVPAGNYEMEVDCIGYLLKKETVRLSEDRLLEVELFPREIELEEVTVTRAGKGITELNEASPSNTLSFNSSDIFSQIKILPGVIGSPVNGDMLVNGGSEDENLVLMDGIPVYHSGHLNTMLSTFNGDAVKGVSFYKSFFPTQFEGRLSSVTDIRMKDGNMNEHHQTLSIDMPSASVLMEGPIIKNKLSYMVSGRRSWLDLFDNIFSDLDHLNNTFYDLNVKISYDLNPLNSLQIIAYRAIDDYYSPTQDKKRLSILEAKNELYALRYKTVFGKALTNTNTIAYTAYSNKAYAEELGFDLDEYIRTGIREVSITSLFNYNIDNIFKLNWGIKGSYRAFDLAGFGEYIENNRVNVAQTSAFFDNELRIKSNLFLQIGMNMTAYLPQHDQHYFSIQPRFCVKYSLGDHHLFYGAFSRMAQFYHHLRIDELPLPTDLRMPSINGFEPRSSNHYEGGWKYFMDNGIIDCSVYYKNRSNTLALRPEMYPMDSEWHKYIMVGKGKSYGIKLYAYNDWKKVTLQGSYAYARSLENFEELKNLGTLPSLYDIPHSLSAAISYRFNQNSSVSVGGMWRSGKIIGNTFDLVYPDDVNPDKLFRAFRKPPNYRVDASYSYTKQFSKPSFRLLLRAGLYNIVGNPPEEDFVEFYSFYIGAHCMPYGAITIKF
ncbi:MAG: TonB-dependent receptor [Bacteroidales bacterium]